MRSAADVLKFWFEDHGPADWFSGKPEFDAEIVRLFGDTHAAIARGEGWSWRSTPDGRLAEIIVLDQFSRQVHRGRAAAYASDGMALVLAQEAVGGGHHNFVSPERRAFFLLPFMHAESELMQQESVRLHTALGNAEYLKYAQAHVEVIRRFGRFPRRNAPLGRPSTPEEEAYIVSSQGAF
jgi:uncharacterized protein (DUF924 family)